MKTLTRSVMSLSALLLIFGCAPNPVKTIDNLKTAFNGESTASAKYAAFAQKAKEEGFDTIAVMFLATSKSESVHADNHRKALEKMGVKVDNAQPGTFDVKTTAENLDNAIAGETQEIDVMYPGFITVAKGEKSKEAVRSFTWALDTEKKHQKFYNAAKDALDKGGQRNLPAKWFVCPVCGNTYDAGSVTEKCDFCMTPKEKFIGF